jgi:anti-sigma regulatory factor (Ser/Thr protein kinase)
MTTTKSERTFAGIPAQVSEARRWTGRRLADAGVCGEVTEDAVMCVSELATNAIQHSRSGITGGRFRLRLTVVPGVWLRIEVHDDGPLTARPAADDAGPLAEGGRGLRLVRELASESGGDGTVRWFRMFWQQAGVPAPAAAAGDGALFALGGGL